MAAEDGTFSTRQSRRIQEISDGDRRYSTRKERAAEKGQDADAGFH